MMLPDNDSRAQGITPPCPSQEGIHPPAPLKRGISSALCLCAFVVLSPCKNRQHGIALVLVLWLILALAGIASGFIYYVRLEAQAVSNQKLTSSALALAEAGVVQAASLLKNDTTIFDTIDDEWAKPMFEGQLLGDGSYTVTIVDEERRANINYASETTMTRLGLRQDISREIAQYRRNNGMFDTISSIRMVNGMDEDSYRLIRENLTTWGEININTADRDVLSVLLRGFGIETDTAKRLADEIAAGQPFTNIDDLSKIVGDETYQSLKPVIITTGGININTASESLLLAYGVDPEIIRLRPFKTISDTSLQTAFTISSKYFSVTSTGYNRGISKTIHAVLNRTLKDERWETRVVYWLEDE